MREHFDLELQSLENHFLEMAQEVLKNGSKTLLAMMTYDQQLASILVDDDKRINDYQIAIEIACANVLALQQPMVSDLRLVLAIMASSSDLERMADHFAGIAKSITRLKEVERSPLFEERLQEMGQDALRMLEDMIRIFPAHTSSSAKELAKQDESLDQAYWYLSKEMISQMKQQDVHIPNGTEYLAILHHIERFGDYIANICERLVYLETGELVELN
ncbi:phosphate signaling complex protein PhoU [Streptococcus pluranimalium]|uniref:phosphate signaling complex protein PhoU n=1 Tax=Streptococcus pluranimalium TaxID=82348 RepID=UPI0039FCE17A